MNLSFFGYQWENKSNFIIIEFEMPIQTRFSTSLKYEVLLCFWVSSYSADSCRSLFRSLKINPFWKAMIPKFQTKGIQNINLSMWNLEIYCLMVGTRIRWSDRCPIDNLTTCCLNKYGHDNENVWTLMKPQFSSRFWIVPGQPRVDRINLNYDNIKCYQCHQSTSLPLFWEIELFLLFMTLCPQASCQLA